jgi:3-hydroxyisobutyrate dehydrogenase
MSANETKVGVVGLGKIGGFVGRAIGQAGYDVVGYDVREEAMREFSDAITPSASPRAVAEASDVVLVAVYDDAQLRDTLTGDEGILGASSLPRSIAVLSTVTLDTVRWAAAEAERAGVALLDCGVTGGQGLREEGKIVVLAGGDEQSLEAARPVLEVFAAPLLHMGPSGAGMQAKLARNLIHYSGWYAAWEGARLAAACGIDIAKLVEAVKVSDKWSGGGTSLLTRGIGPGPADPSDEQSLASRQGSAGYAHKDLTYALALAAEVGVHLPGAELVEQRIDMAVGLAPQD